MADQVEEEDTEVCGGNQTLGDLTEKMGRKKTKAARKRGKDTTNNTSNRSEGKQQHVDKEVQSMPAKLKSLVSRSFGGRQTSPSSSSVKRDDSREAVVIRSKSTTPLISSIRELNSLTIAGAVVLIALGVALGGYLSGNHLVRMVALHVNV